MQNNYSILQPSSNALPFNGDCDKPFGLGFNFMKNKKELWKTIPNIGGYYKISTYGSIKVKERSYTNTFGSKGTKVTIPARTLKLNLDNGYKRVELTVQSPRKTIRAMVHRLVAQVFIPNPENKPHVNRIDGDRSNNHVSNLEWCTQKENVRHAIDFLGFRPGSCHLGKPNSQRRKVKQIDPISGSIVKVWDCILHIKRAKAGTSSIYASLQDSTKLSNGYKWEYA